MNRIPERATILNKQLGGPTTSPPKKRKAERSMQPPRKPGEPATRIAPGDPKRRKLGRITSDTTGTLTSSRPSLAHSNTDSELLARLKREPSEVSISSIPFQRSPSAASQRASRAASAQLSRMQRQQIDFTALKKQADERKLKKERIEQELKDAISTLKKPNGRAAVKEYIDNADRRNLSKAGQGKPLFSHVKKPPNGVQVEATPKARRRTCDMLPQNIPTFLSPGVRNSSVEPQPSTVKYVPSSAAQPLPAVIPGSTVKVGVDRLPLATVQDTPSRGPVKTIAHRINTDSPSNKDSYARHQNQKRDSGFYDMGPPVTPLPARRKSNLTEDLPIGRQLFARPDSKKKTPKPLASSSSRSKNTETEENVPPQAYSQHKLSTVFATPVKTFHQPVSESPRVSAEQSLPGTPTCTITNFKELATIDATSKSFTGVCTSNEMERDIYDALGWNDNVEDLAI
jgi:DNA replication regulator SLD3